ncbi:aldehyde dehydrogenase family protein [Rhodococcus qingshengii]|uniref:aldehyde dehydrogenase family protein n=1 Tax=Rhodococcus qingshengii TaxID=334542 RepID=UPI0024B8FDC1|nr:aldehyde dehydrogenase family protein [Rhodococcus qingshengii]MDJ0441204.1 aldehyde dehydrogenase family protein [Rhodococcus qingshengii]
MLIDGELRQSVSGTWFENISPVDETVLGVTANGGAADVELAIAAARRAFDQTDWSTNTAFRIHCLRQLAEALESNRAELGALLTAEGGVPVSLLDMMQVGPALSSPKWLADFLATYEFERHMPSRVALGAPTAPVVRKEAIGVVAAITAWNFPLFLNMGKIAPALAAGCTVILKPAPDTPWSATALGRIVHEQTDIPPGVFNVLTSSDAAVGEALTKDPRVDAISFTGSTATGRAIGANASKTVKRTLLELGGKSASIVLPDANFGLAIGWTSGGICTHAGQGCALSSRLLLPRSRYEEGIAMAAAVMGSIVVGDPKDPATLIGPVINARQRDRVLAYIEDGKRTSRLIVGGGPVEQFSKGYFVNPTLFADVDPDATIAQEEIFGPVLSVIPYDDVDHAVQISNNSTYGLSGAVFGTDVEAALSVARRIRTGSVSVNGAAFLDNDLPYGGYRQSGTGRERGVEGFEDYLETKTIGVPTS